MLKIKKEQVFNKGCNLLVRNWHLKLVQLGYKWDDQSLMGHEISSSVRVLIKFGKQTQPNHTILSYVTYAITPSAGCQDHL